MVSHLKRQATRRYSVVTISDADYTNSLAHLAHAPTQSAS